MSSVLGNPPHTPSWNLVLNLKRISKFPTHVQGIQGIKNLWCWTTINHGWHGSTDEKILEKQELLLRIFTSTTYLPGAVCRVDQQIQIPILKQSCLAICRQRNLSPGIQGKKLQPNQRCRRRREEDRGCRCKIGSWLDPVAEASPPSPPFFDPFPSPTFLQITESCQLWLSQLHPQGSLSSHQELTGVQIKYQTDMSFPSHATFSLHIRHMRRHPPPRSGSYQLSVSGFEIRYAKIRVMSNKHLSR